MTTKRDVIESAYAFDGLSVGKTFSKDTLEKYRKQGLLMYAPLTKNRYWITEDGIKYLKKVRYI